MNPEVIGKTDKFFKRVLLTGWIVPPKRYVEVLRWCLEMCPHLEIELLLMQSVKVRSFGWVLTQYDWCPDRVNLDREVDPRRGKIVWRHRARRKAFDSRYKDWSNASRRNTHQHQKLEDKERVSPEATGERNQCPDFRLLVCRSLDQYISIILGHPVWVLSMTALGN